MTTPNHDETPPRDQSGGRDTDPRDQSGGRDTDPRDQSGGRDSDPRDQSESRDSDESGRGATQPSDEQAVTQLTVPDMDCPSCAGKVENAVTGLDSVSTVDPQPTTGTLTVTHDSTTAAESDRIAAVESEIVAAVESAGYEVTESDSASPGGDRATQTVAGKGSDSIWRSRRAVETWISGGFVTVGLLFEFLLTSQNLRVGAVFGSVLHLADVVFLLGIAVGGREILHSGYYSARNWSLDIDFLMSVAILGALLASLVFGEALYFEAATLAFLFSVAELLERYSMDRARNSLAELMELSPAEATVKRDGGTETVPVEDVAVGDVVVVVPGEKIPMDGEVVEGNSAVNQAPITGESVPVDKTVGDEVYAGTINEGGYLEVAVTSRASDNTLSRIVELVEDAQSNKTEREQFVERFSAYYTPVVVGFAVLTAVGSPFLLGTTYATAVVYGLTLLVLACPCAFVISTPVSVVSGVTSAANNGVLIKGGNHLEAAGAVDVVAFDKTGTLTEGELTVTDVVPLHGNTEEDVLRCAQGLERRSEHPIGEAIVAEAREAGVTESGQAGVAESGQTGVTESGQTGVTESGQAGVTEPEHADVAEPEVTEFEGLTGKGVRARLDGTPHVAGKPGLFEELGFDLSHVHATTDGGVVTQTARELCDRHNCLDLLDDTVPELQAEGKTVVLVGTEAELEGVIAVADEVRPEAAAAVERLHGLGVERTVMLTGDNERTARAIAEQVGIDDYHAELLPEEKVETVEELVADSAGVTMVGDGINDAPALATATVGVAMGAAGTDTAIETADIALMSDDLGKLPYLYELAHDANGVIRQNVWASLAVKAGLALAVPFGYVPIWLAVLAGDAGMTTAVTGNAMRLSRIEPDET